jgi:hypothetical protein
MRAERNADAGQRHAPRLDGDDVSGRQLDPSRAARQHEQAVDDRRARGEGQQDAPRGGLGRQKQRDESADLRQRVRAHSVASEQPRRRHPEQAAARERTKGACGHARRAAAAPPGPGTRSMQAPRRSRIRDGVGCSPPAR